MAQFGTDIAEDMQLLDTKLKMLKNEYEQYFLGTRKREPHMLRSEVNKMIAIYANVSINNTAMRFKFNNLRARWSAFKRLWDDNLRKIEQGCYERHLFKANLREREMRDSHERQKQAAVNDRGPSEKDFFDAYVSARKSAGQGVDGLTPDKLRQVLSKQEKAIREKTGCDRVRFRVVVENGKAKVKATALNG